MRVAFAGGILGMIALVCGALYTLFFYPFIFLMIIFGLLALIALLLIANRVYVRYFDKEEKKTRLKINFLNWVVRHQYHINQVYMSPKLYELFEIKKEGRLAHRFKYWEYQFRCYMDPDREDYEWGTERLEPVINSVDDFYNI